MAKTKDGFYKQCGSDIGSDSHILLAGGGVTPLSYYLPTSAYNYSNGCLIKTDIPANSNTMVTFRIEGNSYTNKSILTTGYFYNYQDGNVISHTSASHHGYSFGNIDVFCYNDYVYMWFKQLEDYQSFTVTVYSTNTSPKNVNRITNITNATKPTSGISRAVTIVPMYDSGDSDTWRSIYVNNVQLTNNTITSKAVDFIQGAGISLSATPFSDSTNNTITISNSGVRSVSIHNQYVRVNTNGTNTDLTVPYATQSNILTCQDTRSSIINPTDTRYLQAHFKQNSADGLSDGGTFHGVLCFRPYGTNADFSGGQPHQLAFTENGNLWHCKATSTTQWGDWHQILSSNNSSVTTGPNTITVTLGGQSGTLTIPTVVVTDTKVTQSAAASDENYRPLVLGYTSSDTENSGMDSTVTDQVYVTNDIFARVDTGTLYVQGLNTYGPIKSANLTTSYINGNKGYAMINTNIDGFVMLAGMKSVGGRFMHGVNMDKYDLYYTAKSVIDNNINWITHKATLLNEAGNTEFPGLLTAKDAKFQSSATGAGGDVSVELWRGTNASWKILNQGGVLKLQCNYTSTVENYYDVMTLTYNTKTVKFFGDLVELTKVHLQPGGGIMGTYDNNSYNVVYDHKNGNMSYNAMGGNVFLGAMSTDNIYCRQGMYLNLDLGNYNTYIPKLDGTGATGTWGINITGKSNISNHIAVSKNFNNVTTYPTVKSIKDELATFWNGISTVMGTNVIVPYQAVHNWDNESTTLQAGSTYSMIKLNGNYAGSTYGQWLLAGYNTQRIGYVGRSNDVWSSVKWLATLDDIPTSLPSNGGTADKLGTIDKGNTSTPIYLSAGSPMECLQYAGGTKVTLNGASKEGQAASFYAPTSAGTDGYILVSNGSGAPSWQSPSNIGGASGGNSEYNIIVTTEVPSTITESVIIFVY